MEPRTVRRLYLDLNGCDGLTAPDGSETLRVRMDSRRFRGIMDLQVPPEDGQEVACWTDDGDDDGNPDPFYYTARLRLTPSADNWCFEFPADALVHASALGVPLDRRYGLEKTYEAHWREILRGWDLLREGQLESAASVFEGIRTSFDSLSRGYVEPGLQRHSLAEPGLILWLQDRRQEACSDWLNEYGVVCRHLTFDAGGPIGLRFMALLWWASHFEGASEWRDVVPLMLTRTAKRPQGSTSGFPGELMRFLMGESSADQLYASARANVTPIELPGRMVEYHFYAAMKCTTRAELLAMMRQCIQSADGDFFVEARLAEWMLGWEDPFDGWTR